MLKNLIIDISFEYILSTNKSIKVKIRNLINELKILKMI